MLTLIFQLEATHSLDYMTILIANHLDGVTVLREEVLVLTIDRIGSVVHDGVALQNILQTVGYLTLLHGTTLTCDSTANSTYGVVSSRVVETIVVVVTSLDGECLVLV